MIEKFLEKFLPQITERVNENAEVGKALIEALAVLDNYATLNNVELTEEQINQMLGVVPEPAPEPNADIPAEIVEIVEKKKRGRKPKTTWSWRFKTEQEFEQEYGEEWYGGIAGTDVNWGVDMDEYNMAFLEGQPIKMSKQSEALLNSLFTSDTDFLVNVEKEFGIKNPSLSGEKKFNIIKEMLTDKPLPTTAAPTWNWRFKTEEEFKEEYGTDWRTQTEWNVSNEMDYLLGQPIKETKNTKQSINNFIAANSSGLEIKQEFSSLNIYGIAAPKGGRNVWKYSFDYFTDKPLPTAAAPTWNWRFKTEEELKEEYGDDWRKKVDWSSGNFMDYLLGKQIPESVVTLKTINKIRKQGFVGAINTFSELGITSGVDDLWSLNDKMLTDKPLSTAATPTWNWRFKTEEEFKEEYGDDWREEADWSVHGGMDYLLGEEIAETSNSRDVISLLKKGINSNTINTQRELGISSGDDDDWILNFNLLINKPLPTATPAASKSAPKKRGRKPKTAWNWRFKTEEELIGDYGANWRGSWGSVARDYLFGQPIPKTPETEEFIEEVIIPQAPVLDVDTETLFGISSPTSENWWGIDYMMITDKPLPKTAWNWRFKTLQELTKELGVNWEESYPRFDDDMKYLFGQPIQESDAAKEFIDNNKIERIDTEYVLGITNGNDEWFISPAWLTQKPLPTAAAPAKSAPKKRGRKPKSELPEIDLGGLEDIGDIDIDDIDFDNLVI